MLNIVLWYLSICSLTVTLKIVSEVATHINESMKKMVRDRGLFCHCTYLAFSKLIGLTGSSVLILTLYSVRRTAVFPKLANKDTLPVYNMPFESHWAANLRIDISSFEGGSHFERNSFNMRKWTTSKIYQPSSTLQVGILLNYSLFSSS